VTTDEIVVRVTDHGPGIPTRERERVFEPFVHASGVNGDRGSGLGLAIARGFVVLNGGRLWVEAAPGGGASLVMALPAVALPAEVLA
jgi:signal transduction histidine kinase